VDPTRRGPDWMKITPAAGSLFHERTPASLILELLRRMCAELGDVRSDISDVRSDVSQIRSDVATQSDLNTLRGDVAADILSTRKEPANRS
jgi:hypothetical protein